MSSMAFSDNSGMKEDIRSLALALVSALSKKGMKIAFAESCTGGMAGAAVTEISGSSAVFLGSAVTYSNEAKMKILGVLDTTLAEHGAVSSQCAEEMANGARKIYDADIAISVTGIAGPNGGTPEKPVGTVWFALSTKDKTSSSMSSFKGTRQTIRESSVKKILSLILGGLEQNGR